MCQAYNRQYGTNFISLIPANIFGPGDNFDLRTSHVICALIRRFHEAKAKREKVVAVWGSGKPIRDFIYVRDLAEAAAFIMRNHTCPN